MARKRMIDPSFWTDEKLGLLTPLHRLLFMGLISNADDEGRLQGHPALIKAMIFPYDIDITVQQVQKMLTDLHQKGMIQIYSVDAQTYIHITNFLKYQQINRPTPSKLPPPLEQNTQNEIKATKNEHKNIDQHLLNNKRESHEYSLNNHEKLNECSLNNHGELSEYSVNNHEHVSECSLPKEKKRNKKEIEKEIEMEREENKYIPSSANTDMCVPLLLEENTTAEENESTNAHELLNEQLNEQLQQLPPLADTIMAAYEAKENPLTEEKQQGKSKKEEYTPEFEEFWTHYPRKIEKKRAFRVWKTRLREGVPPEVLIRACKHYAEYCARQGTEQRYIKHPSTFLGPDRPYEEFIDGVPAQEMRRNKSWGALRRLYDTRKNPQSPDSTQIIIGEVLRVD